MSLIPRHEPVWQSRSIHLNGADVHYQVAGPEAAAQSIVMIHGLGNDLHLWQPQVQAWAGQYRTVCYDVFGHGQSAAFWNEGLTLDGLAQTLIELVRSLGLKSCALVGTSMGAVIALAAAHKQPQMFSHLVLCGARLHVEPAAEVDVRNRALKARQQGLAPIADVMLQRWFPAAGKGISEAQLDALKNTFLRTSAEGYASCAQALAVYDLRPAIVAASQPMLMICGALDEEIPKLMVQYAALNPLARLLILDSLAHLPNLQDDEVFNRAVKEFLV